MKGMADLEPTGFWSRLISIKDGFGNSKFALLSCFKCAMMALPHSSASDERVLSQVTILKTQHTNKLNAETVTNSLLAKQAILRQGSECHTWSICQSL